MKKTINVLMIARPDHSIQIYESLEKQDKITYKFVTFKVFHRWMKFFIRNPKAYFVSNNVFISWWWTFVNLTIYKLGIKQIWTERNILHSLVDKLFKKNFYEIVLYWPHYCHKAIEEISKRHNDTLFIADVHLPNPQVVFQNMKPVYEEYGIDPRNTDVYHHMQDTLETIENAPAIIVPSEYVVDTYKEYLPDKTYYVVGYGIQVAANYKKRYKEKVHRFVFSGGSITLEKGCDLLCSYFKSHPEYELHLYGSIPEAQEFIFTPYESQDNITFHGSVPKKLLQEEISQYDVGIHLSRFDAYSLSVGEMLGSGLPCIVSDLTGIKDFIIKENVGLVCSLDEINIARSISQIVNPQIYNRFVDNIEDYIKNRHRSFGDNMVSFFSQYIKKTQK